MCRRKEKTKVNLNLYNILDNILKSCIIITIMFTSSFMYMRLGLYYVHPRHFSKYFCLGADIRTKFMAQWIELAIFNIFAKLLTVHIIRTYELNIILYFLHILNIIINLSWFIFLTYHEKLISEIIILIIIYFIKLNKSNLNEYTIFPLVSIDDSHFKTSGI
jgi:hypothetical protein